MGNQKQQVSNFYLEIPEELEAYQLVLILPISGCDLLYLPLTHTGGIYILSSPL